MCILPDLKTEWQSVLRGDYASSGDRGENDSSPCRLPQLSFQILRPLGSCLSYFSYELPQSPFRFCLRALPVCSIHPSKTAPNSPPSTVLTTSLSLSWCSWFLISYNIKTKFLCFSLKAIWGPTPSNPSMLIPLCPTRDTSTSTKRASLTHCPEQSGTCLLLGIWSCDPTPSQQKWLVSQILLQIPSSQLTLKVTM